MKNKTIQITEHHQVKVKKYVFVLYFVWSDPFKIRQASNTICFNYFGNLIYAVFNI